MERAPARLAPEMAASLCAAFADDPGLSWIWPDREDRLQRLPHFFKPIVRGTMANEAQESGLGGAAVRAGLELARLAGAPGYVEVMNPANLGYYRHVGCETVDEFDIPEAGPHVWAMLWRG